MSGEELTPGSARPAPGAVVETQVEEEFADLDVDAPLIGIVMGSKSDMEAMEKAAKELEERGIRFEVRVMSAHREPDTTRRTRRCAGCA
jgi:hypothetical protein